MTPPVSQSSPPPSYPNYQLQAGGGYTSLNWGQGAPAYAGPHMEARLGQSFRVADRHSLSLNGLFRLSHLTSSTWSPSHLDVTQFGLEAGYEFHLVPNFLSTLLYIGMGVNFYHSSDLDLARGPTRNLDNQIAPTFIFGGGFTLGRGILVLTGGIEPGWGVQVTGNSPADAPIGYSPVGYHLGVSLDLARFVDWVGARFPNSPPLESFIHGIQYPHGLIFSDFGFNLNPAASQDRSMRMLEGRLNLQRPSDSQTSFGFGINMAVGVGTGSDPASQEVMNGPYFEFEEAFFHLRLPIGRGVLVQGGKVFMANQALATADGIYFTTIGLEEHESPNNNEITHSQQFHFGYPLSFGGVRLQIPFTDHVMLSAGSLHDWEHLMGPQSGHGGFATFALNFPRLFSTSVTGFVGNEGGKDFSALNLQALACIPYQSNCSLNNIQSRVNLGADYIFGHQGDFDYHSFALFGRLNFNEYVGISARGEVFADPGGVRTGIPQTMWEFSTDLHVQPWRWMRLRAEYRRDQSSTPFFQSASGPAQSQNTISLGAGVFF